MQAFRGARSDDPVQEHRGWGFSPWPQPPAHHNKYRPTAHRYTANAAPYARTWINPVNWFYNPSPVVPVSSPIKHMRAVLAHPAFPMAMLGVSLISLTLDPMMYMLGVTIGLVICAVYELGIFVSANMKH